MPEPTVHELRSFSVECARVIAVTCDVSDTVTSDADGVTSITAAETLLRERGWKLHTDGKATCGPCLDRWNFGPLDNADTAIVEAPLSEDHWANSPMDDTAADDSVDG